MKEWIFGRMKMFILSPKWSLSPLIIFIQKTSFISAHYTCVLIHHNFHQFTIHPSRSGRQRPSSYLTPHYIWNTITTHFFRIIRRLANIRSLALPTSLSSATTPATTTRNTSAENADPSRLHLCYEAARKKREQPTHVHTLELRNGEKQPIDAF